MKLVAGVVGRVADVVEPLVRQLASRDLTVRIDVEPIKVRVRVLDTRLRKGGDGRGDEAEESAEAS